jgi:DNA-directed RNA polymerase specialized sigma24 family protein
MDDEAGRYLTQLADSADELHQRVSELYEAAGAVSQDGPAGPDQPDLAARLRLIEQVTAALRVTAGHADRFRREEAALLHAEGVTMGELASVFGVSRQRVAVLLHQAGPAAGSESAAGGG